MTERQAEPSPETAAASPSTGAENLPAVPSDLRPSWLGRGFLLAAAAVAAHLLYSSISGGPVGGCGPGSGCDVALRSSWAYVLGVPVSALALVAYLGLLRASFLIGSRRSGTARGKVWLVMVAGAAVVIGAGSWFTMVQVFLLKQVCKFCCLAHACAAIGSILVVGRRPIALGEGGRSRNRLTAVMSAAAGLLAVGVVIGIQEAFPHRTNLVRAYLGRMELRPDEAPSIGPRDATRAVVFLFDYTCPHCRDVHARLRTAQERLDRRFSVICLPVPLDGSCNPLIRTTLPQHRQACDYARLGLAVWRCDRDAFPQFDSWMAQEVRLPDLEGAKAHAGQLVGPERLSKAMSDDWIEEMLRKDVRIYQEDSLRAGSAVLPQIVAGNVISVGPILLEDLVDLLRTNLALDQDGSSR